MPQHVVIENYDHYTKRKGDDLFIWLIIIGGLGLFFLYTLWDDLTKLNKNFAFLMLFICIACIVFGLFMIKGKK